MKKEFYPAKAIIAFSGWLFLSVILTLLISYEVRQRGEFTSYTDFALYIEHGKNDLVFLVVMILTFLFASIGSYFTNESNT